MTYCCHNTEDVKNCPCFFIGIFFVIFFSFTSNSYGAQYKVENIDGYLSVKADNAEIEPFFDEISEKFGVKVKVFPEMKEKKITGHFERITLDEGIESLVKENYIFVYSGQKLSEVYILRKGNNFSVRNALLKKYIEKELFSLDELKNLVLENILKNNPNAQLIDVIPHENINGKLVSYLFLFFFGKKPAPSSYQIQSEISDAWVKRKSILKQIQKAQKTNEYDTLKMLYEQQKENSQLPWESENFLSIEVSADYDHPPVKSFHKGIPHDYSMLPAAIELINDKTGINELTFERTFRLSLQGIGFEFVDEQKEHYYADVLNKAVFTDWSVKVQKESSISKKRLERIKTQWMQFIEN